MKNGLIILILLNIIYARIPLENDLIIYKGIKTSGEKDIIIDFISPFNFKKIYLNVEGIESFELFLNDNFHGKYKSNSFYHTINLNNNLIKDGRNSLLIRTYEKNNIKITLWATKYEWFYGTFHIHTTYSDGLYTVSEILNMVNNLGGHFAALSDHNTLEQCYDTAFHQTGNCMPIRATEWTTNDSGHTNILGPEGSEVFEISSIKKMIDDATYRGGLVQINHPCDEELGFGWGHYPNVDPGIDVIEIFNGLIWFPKNGIKTDAEAVAWWHSLLCEGKRIAATGNSDYHGYEPGGNPLKAHSAVYASSNHPDTILKAIKFGKVMICDEMEDSRLYIYADTNLNGIMDLIMGENIIVNSGSKNVKFKVEVENSDLFDELRICSKQGIIYSTTLYGGNYVYEFEKTFSSQDTDFIRAEILNWLGYYEYATNPIYVNYPDYELGPCNLSITWDIPDTIWSGETQIFFHLKNSGLVSPYRFSIFAMVDTNEFYITEYQNAGPGIGEVIHIPNFYGYELIEWKGGFPYSVRLSPDTEFSYWLKLIPKTNGIKSIYTRAYADDRLFIIDKEPDTGFIGPDGERWYKIDIYAVNIKEVKKENKNKDLKYSLKIFDASGRLRKDSFKRGIYFLIPEKRVVKNKKFIVIK
ncbi:MAG: CehA/McbA family metallohydrolase [candidate division WOR-3 bacterium]